MGRTIRTGIDQLSGYRQLAYDPGEFGPPEEDFYELPVLIHYAQNLPISMVTIWGTGLISLGPATAGQKAFMANIANSTDLSQFPGDFIAAGFSMSQVGTFELIDGNSALTGPRIWWSTGSFEITDEGIFATGSTVGGRQVGSSIGSQPYTAGDTVVYWSELSIVSGTGRGDTLNGTDFAETLRGLGGNDLLNGGLGADALEGGAGNDVLNGGGGKDRMWGGDGNDTIHAHPDFRLADGGAGFDTLVFDHSAATGSLVISAAELLARSSVVSIESVEIIGTAKVDSISGSDGNDRLFGGGGFDNLVGGGGNDYLDAGSILPSEVGKLDNGDANDSLPVDIDYLFTANSGGGSFTTRVTQVPLLLYQTAGPSKFAFTVTEAGATLYLNYVFTDAGGAGGNFNFTVVDANNVQVSRPSYDPAIPYVFDTPGTYYLSAGLFSGSSWEYGHLDITLTLQGAQVLTGNRLEGGAGDDTYVVYSAGDQVVETAGGGNDLVRSVVSFALAENVERLTLTGASAINGSGNALDNLIIGNAAANRLSGGDGSDLLIGGAGKDTFVFTADELGTTRLGEHDAILDFQSTQDKIDLTELYAGHVFGGLSAGKATDAAGLSGYKAVTFKSGGSTWLVGDTDGLTGADFAIQLLGNAEIKVSDLVVS